MSNLILGLMYTITAIYTFYRMKIFSIRSKHVLSGREFYLINARKVNLYVYSRRLLTKDSNMFNLNRDLYSIFE